MVMSKDCPKCGYGIMERVLKVEITGEWGEDDKSELETTQEQVNVWRCIDCLYEEEIGDGKSEKG